MGKACLSDSCRRSLSAEDYRNFASCHHAMGGETDAAKLAEAKTILSGCNSSNLDDPTNAARPIAANSTG